MFFTGEAFRVNRQLRARGVRVITGHVLSEISPDGLRGQEVWSSEAVRWQADAVVLVTQREPCDELYRQITADPQRLAREEVESVYRIGDCLAPRLVADCVFDGHRLAREIDSSDPAVPLPFIRELPDVHRERGLAEAVAGGPR
jgi:dimethylamine/trimethylamine dehydrogenase